MRKLDCRRIATISILASLSVGVQLAPRPPNVELTSLICFLTGFLFGIFSGALLGALTMFVNGFLSPYGFAGMLMPFQMMGMTIMGIAGGIYRKSLEEKPSSARLISIEVAALGAFFTLIYDIITNLACAPWYGWNVTLALIMGTWFTVVHVVSNTVLFGAVFFGLVRTVGNVLGENAWSYQKEVG